MDYTKQVEQIFNYLKFNYEFNELEKLLILKRNFNNDLNLTGCFIKDFLILHHVKKNFSDEKLYDFFVLYFEKNIDQKKEILNNILKYAKYYLMLVFENFEDAELLSAISTINACYSLDCYPFIMKIMDNYYQNEINYDTLIKNINSVKNAVLDKFENINNNIDFYDFSIDNNKMAIINYDFQERAVV